MMPAAGLHLVEADAVADDWLAEIAATACQVLAATGLAPGVLGHVSVRVGPEQLQVRCRGPRESGLAYTTADDLKVVPLHGTVPALAGWSVPNELPIHRSILSRHPDVTAVVHAHPAAVVTMSLAGLAWQPIVGAYDIPAAQLAARGIPEWSRSALVNTPALGDEIASLLDDRSVLVLRGHGLVTVGRGTPELALAEAVVNAVAVDSLARMTLAVRAAGGTPEPIADRDLQQLPDLGAAFNVEATWRNLVRRTAQQQHRTWY